ncbi:transcription factor bHLH92 [Tripterygium wilfordii]|uniref:Transcription factor bHLH92 n=1 Tax=Tripterygium wilfordii TaxID=458696 RepID=A0A7J7CS03_TRIWF|nr:transcription factor bHLH92-like [Tripterygium wilfordii]KAF5736778.1 transcription factor bHLH92 [Tripterygium wilfordii]
MDWFSPEQYEHLWSELFPVIQTAFVPYTTIPTTTELDVLRGQNMNKRMIDFMRRTYNPTPPARIIETQVSDRERGLRHKMSERIRRNRERESYSALHSILPPGTKNSKKGIVDRADKSIRELQSYKEALERQNNELEAQLAAMEENGGGRKIRLSVPNPTSVVDSMLEVLKCFKCLGFKIRNIQSKLHDQELVIVVDIETEIGADEVKTAVERILEDGGRKLLFNYLSEE